VRHSRIVLDTDGVALCVIDLSQRGISDACVTSADEPILLQRFDDELLVFDREHVCFDLGRIAGASAEEEGQYREPSAVPHNMSHASSSPRGTRTVHISLLNARVGARARAAAAPVAERLLHRYA